MFIFVLVLCAIEGYLLGSINFAIIVSRKFYKEDVRAKGSGNAGMTNILRTYGKKGAALTLLGDILKGVLAVWIGRWLFMWLLPGVSIEYGAYIAAIFAIVGHTFPVYFKFKGGKGVAVSGGVIIALQPIIALILILIFAIIVLCTKIVSLGSVIGMALYGPATLIDCLITKQPNTVFCTICACIISVMVIWMHRENIKRLLNGTEYKFGEKKKTEE